MISRSVYLFGVKQTTHFRYEGGEEIASTIGQKSSWGAKASENLIYQQTGYNRSLNRRNRERFHPFG